MWHTWTSSNGEGVIGLHRGLGHSYAAGWHVTGDYEEGILYAMDADTYTDNGNYIQWERTSPHISTEMKRIFFDTFRLDFFVGNLDTDIDPRVVMQFSDDGGATWSEERVESAGLAGQFAHRTEFRRLGSGRNRVFRIRMTDPKYWAIVSASLDTRLGAF